MVGGAFSRRDFAHRRLQRKRDNIRKKTGVALLGIIVLLGLIIVLSRIEALQFQQIVVEGERHINERNIAHAIEGQLDRRIVWVIPRSNVLLFSKQSAVQQLIDQFPRIYHLEIDRKIFARTVQVSITERELWMVLCDAQENDCVSVSRDGIAYAQSPTFSGNLVTKVINEEEGEVKLGREVLAEQLRNIILLYTDEIAVSEIGRPQFIIKNNNEVHIQSSEGWYIIADLTSEPANAYQNMLVTLREEIGEDRSNLEYIDTRFGSRVFYKNK